MYDTDTRVKKRYTALRYSVEVSWQTKTFIWQCHMWRNAGDRMCSLCICMIRTHVWRRDIQRWGLMTNKDIDFSMSYQCLCLTCIWMSLFNIDMKVIWMSFFGIHMIIFCQHIHVGSIFWQNSVFVGYVVYVNCAFKKNQLECTFLLCCSSINFLFVLKQMSVYVFSYIYVYIHISVYISTHA